MESLVDEKEKIYLFSYGSMKRGFKNHYRLESDKFIGVATTIKKYNMYPANSFNYPYAIEKEKRVQLKGELYELTSTSLNTLDIFEGSPDYYYRKEIDVISESLQYRAFIYFRTSSNPTGMEVDIPLSEWTLDFEQVGIKQEEMLEKLMIALKNRRGG